MKIEITEEDRDWIERRAYDLYRGWTRNKVTQDIRPHDGFDYWLVNATVERMEMKLVENIKNEFKR